MPLVLALPWHVECSPSAPVRVSSRYAVSSSIGARQMRAGGLTCSVGSEGGHRRRATLGQPCSCQVPPWRPSGHLQRGETQGSVKGTIEHTIDRLLAYLWRRSCSPNFKSNIDKKTRDRSGRPHHDIMQPSEGPHPEQMCAQRAFSCIFSRE